MPKVLFFLLRFSCQFSDLKQALFDVKDFMDYRYFHKKAYYVACMAAALRENTDCKFKLKFAYQNGNPLQPMIVAESSEGLS